MKLSILYLHPSQFAPVIAHLQKEGYEIIGEYFDDVYMEHAGHIFELRVSA